jgi:hypothetical protein
VRHVGPLREHHAGPVLRPSSALRRSLSGASDHEPSSQAHLSAHPRQRPVLDVVEDVCNNPINAG